MSKQKDIPSIELESLLTDLRSQNKAYLNCVKIVKDKYGLALYEACDLVLDSQAFADQREDIIQGLRAGEEEIIEAMMERNMVESIEVTMSPSQARTVYKIEVDRSQNKPSQLDNKNEEL
jgi:hypothetical protein